jgi:glycosyltransferase involved in cell wall biosynthesis
MFSVIIPLYNKELSISNTIQSVLDQTFQDFEIVIVNDGSTDNSVKEVEKFDDKRIRLIHQENQGVSAARNRGIEEANYEWIAFLDGDDLWRENHLKTLDDMIKKYPIDKVFTTSYIQSNQTETEKPNNTIDVIDNYFKAALERRVTWTSIMCANKEVFDKVGGFNIKLSRGEDLDLWARIGREYRYIKSNLITAIYRVGFENNLTTGRSVYNKSILSVIDLKVLEGDERKYFKRMITGRLKSNIKHR